MRSFLRALMLVAGALAVFASSASAGESDRDTFVNQLAKRSGDGTYKRGLCTCTSGAQNGRAGVIGGSSVATGNVEYFYTTCDALTFDRSTGAYVSSTPCDGTWIPLPK